MGTRISALAAATALTGTEVAPVVQGGGDVKATIDQIRAYCQGSSVSTQAGSAYTAVLADANTYIRFTNAGAVVFTIPANSAVAYPIGTVIEVEQAGAGGLTVAGAGGVSLLSRGSDFTLAGQNAVAAVRKVGTDTWVLAGDL
jgi:uncharacterized protein YqgV (UPF0045/DUF77 family)